MIALLFGSLLLIDTTKTNLAVQHSIIYGAAGSLSAIILLIGYFVAREHGRVATTGSEGLIGELVEVREVVAPDSPGKVFVHGEIWRARSDEVLPPGAHARITSVSGLEVRVQRASLNSCQRATAAATTAISEGSIMAGAGAALVVVIFFFVIFMLGGIRVLNEYERAVVFRLGRLTPYRGPGVTFIIPVLEKMARIDLRTVTPRHPATGCHHARGQT